MSTSQVYGLRPGGTAAQALCPAGQWMTGFRVGVDGSIQRWAGTYCQSPQALASGAAGQPTLVAPSGNAGSGGSDVDFQCAPGSYIDTILTEYDDGVKRLTPTCRSLATGQITAQGLSVGTQTGKEPTSPWVCGPYTGVDTTADGPLRQLRYHCSGEATATRQDMYTPLGQARCCMGLEPAGRCGMLPQSGACDQFMSAVFCPANPTHPYCSCLRSPIPCPNKFDGSCITNAGYRTQDMLSAPCPDVITCQQFVTFGPQAQALATNVEQNCPNATSQNKQQLQEAPLPTTSVLQPSSVWFWVLLLIILVLVALIGLGAWWVLTEDPGEAEAPEEAKREPKPAQ